MKSYFVILVLATALAGCAVERDSTEEDVATVSIVKGDTSMYAGTLSKSGVTTYQYGTHVLSGWALDGNPETTGNVISFALQSKIVNLDEFVGKKVIVTGTKVEGYPLENGPDLIEVSAVELDGVVKTQ